MKITVKNIILVLLFSIAFIGCEEDEKNPLNLLELEDSKSPFVRIVLDQTVVAQGDLGTSALSGVVDDASDNVASWELSVSRESGGVVSDTVPLTNVTSFPSNLNIPFTDIASALGITVNEIQGGDFIRFLGTATGNDGTVATSENFSANVTGQPEQRQAFNFIVLIKCSPIDDATLEGTWIVEMEDSFGDGWDGAFVTFEIDGVSTNYTFTSGNSATFNIDVPSGTSELVISYTSGAFEEEHSYTVETPDGDIRGPFGAPGPDGPGPPPCIN